MEVSVDFAPTPEQADTATLLDRLFGGAIANRYNDFCRLTGSATGLFVSRPLAAHALREIESIIRSSLEVPMDAKTTPTKDGREAQVEKALKALSYDPDAIRDALKSLKPRLSHANQIKRIAERLGFPPESDLVTAWIGLSRITGKAHDRAFHRSLSVDDDFRETFQRPFDLVLRGIATSLQKQYATLMQRVEQIAEMPDKNSAIKIYEREIPGALPLQWHFFQKIQSPAWLHQLLKRNLVGAPVETAIIGTKRLREWPIGHYLLNLAKGSDASAHQDVSVAIRRIAYSTHPDVRQRGLEIIAALPPGVAASLIDVATGWLDANELPFYQAALESLIKRLAAGGYPAKAISLAEVVFQVFDHKGGLASLYPHGMYEHDLHEVAKVLMVADGLSTLRLESTRCPIPTETGGPRGLKSAISEPRRRQIFVNLTLSSCAMLSGSGEMRYHRNVDKN